MTVTTDARGGRWDNFDLIPGHYWGPHTLTFKDANGIVNLEGCTGLCQFYYGSRLIASASLTFLTPRSAGQIRVWMTPQVSALLAPYDLCVLRLSMTDSLGRPVEMARGDVKISHGAPYV